MKYILIVSLFSALLLTIIISSLFYWLAYLKFIDIIIIFVMSLISLIMLLAVMVGGNKQGE